jgi:hypothetical protein
MWHSFYVDNPLLWLPLVAMGVFITAFVVGSARAWKNARTTDASMPLADDSDALSSTGSTT